MNTQIGPYTQTPEAKAAYDARLKRFTDSVQLKRPDKLPTSLMSVCWHARYGGITVKELMYNFDKANDLTVRAAEEFQLDTVSSAAWNATVGPILDAMEFRQLEWPGHGLGDNQAFQYLDREYMTADEYDDFLFDPTGYYWTKYLPRVAGTFDGLEPLGRVAGNFYFALGFAAPVYLAPPFQTALKKLQSTAEQGLRYVQNHIDVSQRLAALGFPQTFDTLALSPYDLLGDLFRGATNLMKDMYRHKDKLLATLDKMSILILRQTLAAVSQTPNKVVFIPIHWAPDPFMSQKQFETFWWPPFKKFLLGLIDAGVTPMVLWESICTKRLETIRDIPAGKCVYWFESTDLIHAYEVLGDVVAIKGNISSTTLITGTPKDVDLEVKRLVDGIWNKGGSFILDSAGPLPDEAPVENVRAMYNAARKYAG